MVSWRIRHESDDHDVEASYDGHPNLFTDDCTIDIFSEFGEPDMQPPFEPVSEPVTQPPFEPVIEPVMQPPFEPVSDSDDIDFFVDEDNLLDDHDIDMRDFYMNIDENVEWVGDTSGGTEDIPVIFDEEVEVINNDVLYSGSSSDGGYKGRRRNKVRAAERARKNQAAEVSEPFYKYQKFSSAQEAKDRIYVHAIETRRQLFIVKNDLKRVRSICIGGIPNLGILSQTSEEGGSSQKIKSVKESSSTKCPWVLLVSKFKKDDNWTVKTYVNQHICSQTRKVKACDYKYLSKDLLDQLQSNPEIPIRSLKEQLVKKYQLEMSDMKVFRAKAKALETIRGDYGGQYSVLRDYILELQTRNPNTTVKLQVENEYHLASETRVFKRIYVCLGPLKKGFAACKRDLLGLDGCFMKGPYPGFVLTAVGSDGNNCTYPVAYAIVESENKDSWSWFLTNLGDDLELTRMSNFTFITDRQKGLIPAIAELFPCVEHRYCLRHIHENMKLKWRGKEFKDCLWKCATSTTVQGFNVAMLELKKLNNAAYDWLKAISPKHWSRSHFTGRAHCDALLNNMCEALNSKLVKGRDKPIITCLEFIREYIMKKLVVVQMTIDKSHGPLTPTASKTLDKIKLEAADYRAVFCGNNKYQVAGHAVDQYVVDMGQRTCSCNKWEITGMPCRHAIAAVWEMGQNNENIGVPERLVHPTYWLQTWKEMYAFKIEPINGRNMWEKVACPTKLLPPKYHVPVGRPKKKRIRGALEGDGTKIKSVTCSKCGNVGHNERSCKGQPMGQNHRV